VSSVVISVDGLGKQYRLGVLGRRTLARDLQSWWALRRGREDPNAKIGKEAARKPGGGVDDRIWALRDVSLDVRDGEVFGIIGRNGAGKSTLLKILSRVTAPTTGEVRVRGRVASLLEVGTGFHPELTGRENVFLNGAILGMTKKEIAGKFDEIVAFSDIERFIDTPVKRYSSGMYVRLAFAVAAHLDPEILVIDEVLAVGDAAFQKKCLGKMGEVAGGGRTVLFVSHNMHAIRQICPQAMWLEDGRIRMTGTSDVVVGQYLDQQNNPADCAAAQFIEDAGKQFQVLAVTMHAPGGQPVDSIEADDEITLRLECVSREPVPGLYGYLALSTADGMVVLESDSLETGSNPFDNLAPGRHVVDIRIPARTLGHGKYYAYLNFASPLFIRAADVDRPGNAIQFTVLDSTSRRGNRRKGFVSAILPWETVQ
jgi:lipopolysaccharide transport system ATP-binding protein